jgi:ATP-dependent exoDNAse (exonuclease V) beta subunit
MKWNKLYEYPKSIRSLIKERDTMRLVTRNLPSVTTILAATESDEKRAAIAKWKVRVGAVEAERVKNTAATRGTAMHSYLEHHIAGQGLLDLTESGVEAKRMAEVVVEKGLGDLDEIWGSECVLYYPELYAGQTDLCGVYQGRESIVDFKQSNKPKREEYIGDYYLQLVAYAMAHDAIYKTNIEQGVILMCTPDLYFQKFVLNGARFRQVKWEWLRKVDEYYKNKKANI